MNRKHSESALLELLARVLKAIPTVERLRWEREPRSGAWRYGARLSLVLKGSRSPQRWLVETKGQPLEPLKAELFALRLAAARAEEGAHYAVLVAPFVSPRAAEVLGRHGIGFVDSAGNCLLSVRQLYIERTGFPNPIHRKPLQRSLFSKTSERVLRPLLDPGVQGRKWTVRELATSAYPGVSVGQTQKVLRLLEELNFVSRDDDGTLLLRAEMLLREWAANYLPGRNHEERYFSLLNEEQLRRRFESLLAERGRRIRLGALASFSAAADLAPSVRQHRSFFFWRGDHRPVIASLELKPVSDGDNVVVLEPYDEGVLYPGGKEASAATSPVQTFLDLYSEPGRGREAAEALFERVLRKAYGK